MHCVVNHLHWALNLRETCTFSKCAILWDIRTTCLEQVWLPLFINWVNIFNLADLCWCIFLLGWGKSPTYASHPTYTHKLQLFQLHICLAYFPITPNIHQNCPLPILEGIPKRHTYLIFTHGTKAPSKQNLCCSGVFLESFNKGQVFPSNVTALTGPRKWRIYF